MSNQTLLLPSMMCADAGHLALETERLSEAGADGFHLDLMDGTYVPNYGMGSGEIEWVIKHSDVPCDVHMMSVDPGRYVERFADMGARVIYVHPEADVHVARTLAAIRAAGVHPGIAINPGTSIAAIEPVLSLVDYVMVMTVNPGFAGQTWLDFVNPKISRLAELGREMGFDVVIDGNCSPEHIAEARAMGARGFVLGTASLFGKGRPYEEILDELRTL